MTNYQLCKLSWAAWPAPESVDVDNTAVELAATNVTKKEKRPVLREGHPKFEEQLKALTRVDSFRQVFLSKCVEIEDSTFPVVLCDEPFTSGGVEAVLAACACSPTFLGPMLPLRDGHAAMVNTAYNTPKCFTAAFMHSPPLKKRMAIAHMQASHLQSPSTALGWERAGRVAHNNHICCLLKHSLKCNTRAPPVP